MNELYQAQLAMWDAGLETISEQQAILDQRRAWAERQRSNWLGAIASAGEV